MKRVAGLDMGVVNYAVAVIDHCPAERRRKRKAPDTAPLELERTRLVGLAYCNWEADAAMLTYDVMATPPWTERRGLTWNKETAITVTDRLCAFLADWAPLHNPAGSPPMLVMEQPGAPPHRDAGSTNNHLALHATYACIAGVDKARGRVRRKLVRAKKADVKRGSKEYRDRKAESVASAEAHATACGDGAMLEALRRLRAMKSSVKLDDVCDAYNIAREWDRRTIKQRAVDVAEASDSEESTVDLASDVARPAKRRRLLIDLTAN